MSPSPKEIRQPSEPENTKEELMTKGTELSGIIQGIIAKSAIRWEVDPSLVRVKGFLKEGTSEGTYVALVLEKRVRHKRSLAAIASKDFCLEFPIGTSDINSSGCYVDWGGTAGKKFYSSEPGWVRGEFLYYHGSCFCQASKLEDLFKRVNAVLEGEKLGAVKILLGGLKRTAGWAVQSTTLPNFPASC